MHFVLHTRTARTRYEQAHTHTHTRVDAHTIVEGDLTIHSAVPSRALATPRAPLASSARRSSRQASSVNASGASGMS